MAVLEDEKIVDLFMARNEDAIKETAEKYGKKIRSLSLRITGDHETAEECESDTYMEAWKRIPPNEPRDYFFRFLMKIVRNISINRVTAAERQKRNATFVELTAEMEQCIPAPDREVEETGATELISAFLKGLSKEKRIMFVQRYYFFESISAIAKRTGWSDSKVKTTLFRIRKDLREYLIKEGYRP